MSQLDEITEALGRLVALETGRQGRVDELWSRIPEYATHSGYTAAPRVQGTGYGLDVLSDTSNLVRYTNFIATLPAGATGLLTIGQVVIPMAAGLNSAFCSILVPQGATRNLSSTVSGPMALVLMGEVVPQWGAFS